jgi:alpha-beta hydrolase superfamily lysophospholipase
MTAIAIPSGIVPSEGTAKVADGTTLRTLHWAPQGDPWAVALVVHGLGEHAGRYGTVAGALTAAGIDVYAYDHRGFGGSAGVRAYVDKFSQFHDDLAERVLAARAACPGLPLVMYGHSLGGLITTGYVLSGRDLPMPDLLVLSAPGLDAEQPAWKKSLAKILTGITPKMKLANGLAKGGLSRDPAVEAAVDADPLCINTSTVRFGAEAFAEQERVQAAIAGISAMPMPTYVFHGSADPIVAPAASAILEGKGNVTRRVHEGLRHECHHEPEHEQVLAEVVAWIRANTDAPAAAPTDPVPTPAGEPVPVEATPAEAAVPGAV